jgi:UDP-N-acetylmuramate dehydrogenase
MIEVYKDELLSRRTFYGIGGPVDEFYILNDIDGVGELWAETLQEKIPYLVLGKGSNLCAADAGLRGRVFFPQFSETLWKGNVVTVGAGKNFQNFIEETNRASWEDLCNLSGIPGNVGGFVRGNAGAFGVETADFLLMVEYLDEFGQLQILKKEDGEFAYRESVFKFHPEWLIVRATFQLSKPADSAKSLEKTKNLLKERWQKYPPGKSGGSFFKNPELEKVFAGALLEQVGAKRDRIGHAQVSEKHANFFLNLEGTATQADLLALARKWKAQVWEKFQVKLEPEVMLLDEYGKKIEL